MTWPLQILENQLYVSAAHIDFAAFVLAGIGTGHAVELEAVG